MVDYSGQRVKNPARWKKRSLHIASAVAAAVAVYATLGLRSAHADEAQQTADCNALVRANIKETRIELAQVLPTGSVFKDPDGKPVMTSVSVCRVVATVSTEPTEQVGIEVWLPLDGWNRRLLGVGSGGFGGSIVYSELAPAVARGFVAANTNTGHTGGAQGAIGQKLDWARNPMQLRDWGHTSIHLMTVAAKAITRAYYGQSAKKAYYSGCSTGGAEAMEEVEYFPDDYDGVHAGSPGMGYSHLMESFFWGAKLPSQQPEATLTPETLTLLNRAVLKRCGDDAAVEDGFLENPLACHFDPAQLQCTSSDDAAHCLSAAQVHEAQRLYSPVLDSRDGKQLYPGFARGSESQWNLIQGALVPNYAQPLVANTVFDNPVWDWTTFDFGADADRVDAKLAPVSDAMHTDLSRFKAHGGKLIMTQGWADSLNAQTLPIEFFDAVAAREGGVPKAQRFFRLVMVPGMSHCGGGPGPGTIGGQSAPTALNPQRDVVSALQDWVEGGKAPHSFVSTKYVDDKPSEGVRFERTLCVYPLIAKYDGHGDRRRASSFSCVASQSR